MIQHSSSIENQEAVLNSLYEESKQTGDIDRSLLACSKLDGGKTDLRALYFWVKTLVNNMPAIFSKQDQQNISEFNLTKEMAMHIRRVAEMENVNIDQPLNAMMQSPGMLKKAVVEGGIFHGQNEDKSYKITYEIRKSAVTKLSHEEATISLIADRPDQPIWKVKVSLTNQTKETTPQAGDVMLIRPENNGETLKKLQQYCHILESSPENEQIKQIESGRTSSQLIHYIHQRLVQENMAQNYDKESVRKILFLNDLIHKNKEKAEYILEKTHLVDVLEAFPNLLTLSELKQYQGVFVNMRKYTIAGIHRDSKGQPEAVDLFVSSSAHKVPELTFGSGKTYHGACVNYIKNLEHEEHKVLNCTAQRRSFGNSVKGAIENIDTLSDADRDILKQPVIFFAAGSGLSGICAVLQERRLLKEKGVEVGPAYLLFGMRNKMYDIGLQNEVEMFLKEGTLSDIKVAESRPSKGVKKYIQDFLSELGTKNHEEKENPIFQVDALKGITLEELRNHMLNGGIRVIICGDKAMGECVEKKLVEIALPDKEIIDYEAEAEKFKGMSWQSNKCTIIFSATKTRHETLSKNITQDISDIIDCTKNSLKKLESLMPSDLGMNIVQGGKISNSFAKKQAENYSPMDAIKKYIRNAAKNFDFKKSEEILMNRQLDSLSFKGV